MVVFLVLMSPWKDKQQTGGISSVVVHRRTDMNRTLLFAILCLPSVVLAQNVHIVHCSAGCPTGTPPTNDLVVREIYALSNNRDTKFADWVAYRVTGETIGTSDSLNRSWKKDDLLDGDETLEPRDYRGASDALDTDRGHQAPLASFAGTRFWRVTNFLSNITPQKSELNQGPWRQLEEAVRDVAYASGEVYVVTGPTHDPNEEAMQLPGADEPHQVPTGYFKVVADGKGRVTAFLFDQDTDSDMDYCDGITTLKDVQKVSGLTIFPDKPDWPRGNLVMALGCQNS